MVNEASSNKNFKGTISSADLPKVHGRPSRWSVEGAGHLKVTAGVGTRVLAIAAGSAWGDAILSTWLTATSLTGDVVSSGSRWDTVAIEREWTPLGAPTGTARIVLLTGGSSKVLSPSRLTNAGVTKSHQPLALVKFSAGQTAVQEIADLRVWGANSGLVAADVAALQYLTDLGTQVRVGDTLYTRALNSSGAPAWVQDEMNRQRVVVADVSNPIARLAPSGQYGSGMQLSVSDVGSGQVYIQDGDLAAVWGVNSDGVMTTGKLPAESLIDIPAGSRHGGNPQSIPKDATTTYIFPSDTLRLSGGVTNVGGGGLVVSKAGWYMLTATMRWSANGTSFRSASITVNGVPVAQDMRAGSDAASATQNLAAARYLSAGSEIHLEVTQGTSGSLSSAPTGNLPNLAVAWLGANS